MKRKMAYALSAIVVILGTIVLQIYNIAEAFVNGKIWTGVLFSTIFIAYLIWLMAMFLEGDSSGKI